MAAALTRSSYLLADLKALKPCCCPSLHCCALQSRLTAKRPYHGQCMYIGAHVDSALKWQQHSLEINLLLASVPAPEPCRGPALHCIALHCTALQWTALHCTALPCPALHCRVPQLHVAWPVAFSYLVRHSVHSICNCM